jgi:hypothetical protein
LPRVSRREEEFKVFRRTFSLDPSGGSKVDYRAVEAGLLQCMSPAKTYSGGTYVQRK